MASPVPFTATGESSPTSTYPPASPLTLKRQHVTAAWSPAFADMRFLAASGSLYGVAKPLHPVRPVPVHVVSRVPVHVVGPVTVSRDGWDWAAFWIAAVSGLAAVIAIGIAVVAIRWVARIGQDADSALIRERQLTFELGVLVRVAELERREAAVGSARRSAGCVRPVPR